MNIKERGSIIRAKCTTTGEDIFSNWKNFKAGRFNFEFKYVHCPSKCWD